MLNLTRGPVRSLVRKLLKDPSLSFDILYRIKGDSEFDSNKGRYEDKYEDFDITVVKLVHTRRSVYASSNSSIESGDAAFIVPRDLLPTDKVSMENKIFGKEDNKEYNIKDINTLHPDIFIITTAG